MIETAVFDAKPYDREYLTQAVGANRVAWRFHEFLLSAETASAAKGARAVCVFVNDKADRACLETLAALGVTRIALRCAGYNNVDLAAAHALGLAVVRVPAYSPHAVAEHSIGLLRTLNRKIHRAYHRVRELNFSLSGLVGFDLHGKTVGIGGVALDVYEEEEGIFFEDLSSEVLQDDELSRLLTFPNVLITAHQAFLTHEALSGIARVTTENLSRLATAQSFLPENRCGTRRAACWS